MADTFQKFLFETLQIRGEWVRLSDSWLQCRGDHDYPAGVLSLLGEAAMATVLMTGTLKFEGRLSLHARGGGVISLLMAEATNKRTYRCIADYDESIPSLVETTGHTLKEMLGEARLAITIEPNRGSRYQGIVPMERASIADCLAHYFELSEQLDTQFMFWVSDSQCIGLMLQKLPDYREIDDQDAWDRILHLTSTLSQDEVFSHDNASLLHRLFHQERVQLFDEEPVTFSCSCSRERSAASIEALGEQEALNILEEERVIAVDCQFCRRHYEFDRQAVQEIFGMGAPH